jgi:hypothetical protein
MPPQARGTGRGADGEPRSYPGHGTLLADWPPGDCREFARLITRFAEDVSRHLTELDC